MSDELAQVRTKKKKFLAELDHIVPWGEWLALIQPCYYKGERGNKPYDLERMLRIYLVRYLEDGRLELSNNRAERSIKRFVMGRKNFLFCNTPGGAQSSVVLYSLIETAKETGLDPYRYLLWVLERAPRLAQKADGA